MRVTVRTCSISTYFTVETMTGSMYSYRLTKFLAGLVTGVRISLISLSHYTHCVMKHAIYTPILHPFYFPYYLLFRYTPLRSLSRPALCLLSLRCHFPIPYSSFPTSLLNPRDLLGRSFLLGKDPSTGPGANVAWWLSIPTLQLVIRV